MDACTALCAELHYFHIVSVVVMLYLYLQNVFVHCFKFIWTRFQYQTKWVTRGGKKEVKANQLLNPSSTHPRWEYKQLWGDYIHLNIIWQPVEWCTLGSRVGWCGGVVEISQWVSAWSMYWQRFNMKRHNKQTVDREQEKVIEQST